MAVAPVNQSYADSTASRGRRFGREDVCFWIVYSPKTTPDQLGVADQISGQLAAACKSSGSAYLDRKQLRTGFFLPSAFPEQLEFGRNELFRNKLFWPRTTPDLLVLAFNIFGPACFVLTQFRVSLYRPAAITTRPAFGSLRSLEVIRLIQHLADVYRAMKCKC